MDSSLRQQILSKIDRMLIDACESGAQDAARVPSDKNRPEFERLTETAQCAIAFVKQWIIDGDLKVDLPALESFALESVQSSESLTHVHQWVWHLFWAMLKRDTSTIPSETNRNALTRLRSEIAAKDQARADKALENTRNAFFLLEFDPADNQKAAVVMLAQILDPDVLESL